MAATVHLTAADLRLEDPQATIEALAADLRAEVRGFRRRGAVVALSGGIDSSVVAALAVRALSPEKVLGVLMPEADSAADTLPLSEQVADHLGIATELEDLTPLLEAVGCYRRRDDAIRRALPEYGAGWRAKIVLPSAVDSDAYRLFSVVAEAPDGRVQRARLDPEAYLQVVAATSFKQRSRAMLAYFHADRLNYAVLGTPNRLEYDLGFFVKNGDGAADVKPIAHLYKSQVYELAEALGLPASVRTRPPTTDTYALPQSQDEFYFALPYAGMDLCLLAVDRGLPPTAVTDALGLTEEQATRVFADIAAKRRVARYLHAAPRLLGSVPSVAESAPSPAPATATGRVAP